MSQTTGSPRPIQPSCAISLLTACGLPAQDLEQNQNSSYFGWFDGPQLIACVGMERCGPAALLRSLAVAADYRKTGLGRALVKHIETLCADQGVTRLYLLTTTAGGFFERLGYQPEPREKAPPGIRQTAQFAGICPASSAFMAKTLADG